MSSGQVAVGGLEDGVETLQHVAVAVFQLGIHIQHVEYRLVILVNEHHAAAARLLVDGSQHFRKAVAAAQLLLAAGQAVFLLPLRHQEINLLLQLARVGKVGAVEVHMKHGVSLPLRLQPLDGQPLEQLLAPLEVVLQGRHQQALAEAARAAQEVNLAFVRQFVNQLCLVHVDVSVFDYLVKALYSDGIFHGATFLFLQQLQR